MIDIKHVLKNHAYQNIPLTYEEAYELGVLAVNSCNKNVSSKALSLMRIQSVTALSALHNRATYSWRYNKRQERAHGHKLPRNSAEQIAGICAAIFYEDMEKSPFGFLHTKKNVMDNCGMGGDLVLTANVSTLAAFIAAAAGIAMCKHGSPGNSVSVGSSDFISRFCGINTYVPKDQMEQCVNKTCFGYTEALDTRYKLIHMQTHRVAQLPHMNDIIGPITNPVDPLLLTKRILGVNHLIQPKIVAEAYKILNEKGITNLQHGLMIRGFADKQQIEGMDEASICSGGTSIAELRAGEITEYHLQAGDFGLKPVTVESIIPNGSKGKFSLAILRGEIDGPPLQMVLANAALLFYLADRSTDLRVCYQMAEEVHYKGGAYEKMMTVREMLSKH